ncbi:MFS transporter [Burkholderia cepacia]|uniref:MFS transporter n=1 Tax=Burkholderia cepacia TaxID=292 RepID=UPI0038BDF27A
MARARLSLVVLVVGVFMTTLDLFIVNIALESIRRGLHADAAALQLVMVGYSAAYGVLMLNAARLGDLYGRRKVFLTGLAVFTAASVLCGLAPTPLALIGARVLQGAGAALLTPQVFASLRVLFDGDARRRAFGILGISQGLASPVAQIAGGFLLAHAPGGPGWRLLFFVNLPIGLATLVAGRALIVETRAPVASRLDLHGALVVATGIALLLVPFMEGQEYGWPWWSVALPALSLPVFVHFVQYERTLAIQGGVPVIDISLFNNRRFVAGTVAVFFFYSAISSFFLSLTLLLQAGLALSPVSAGLVFTPTALAFLAGSIAGPRLARAFGHKALLGGVISFGTGLALSIMVGIAAPREIGLLIISLIFNGLGQGLVIPLALHTILGSVREDQAGMSSGTIGTMQTVGTSAGVAIVGVLFFSVVRAAPDAAPATLPTVYGSAFAHATIYNAIAACLSLVGFIVVAPERDAS